MKVSEMRSKLAEAYPFNRFGDTSLYPDYQIRAIYRDKKAKLPKYQWVPVELVMRDGFPTVIVERRRVG